MTALEQYIRLEAEALWQEHTAAEPRSVIVSFGNASLVVTDFNDAPLAHWSLAATRIVGREEDAVVYAPDDKRSETLRISDAQFVEAIRAVSASTIQRTVPRRWKSKAIVAGFLTLLIAGVLVLPGVLKGWARGNISDEQLVLITDTILDRADIGFCAETRATEAMERLQDLVLQRDDKTIYMGDIEAQGVVRLPDGRAIVDVSVFEKAGNADGFAGWLALSANLPDNRGGLDTLMEISSTWRVLQFAFSGVLSEDEYGEITEATLSSASSFDPVAVAEAIARLNSAGINPAPFRESLNLPAITENGPFRPSLNDQDWLALQRICRD